jgi:cytochrome P450
MQGSFIKAGLNQDELEGEAMAAMIAGSDTSATAIRGLLYNVLRSPRVYHRFKDEIRQHLACNDVSYPISYSQTKDFPYLQVSEVSSQSTSGLGHLVEDLRPCK